MELRPLIHIALHVIVPLAVARLFFRWRFLLAATLLLSANGIDVDHLLAEPIYDPNRCSIGFHPLHSQVAGGFYLLALLAPSLRLLALGALIHLGLDGLDCWWMKAVP